MHIKFYWGAFRREFSRRNSDVSVQDWWFVIVEIVSLVRKRHCFDVVSCTEICMIPCSWRNHAYLLRHISAWILTSRQWRFRTRLMIRNSRNPVVSADAVILPPLLRIQRCYVRASLLWVRIYSFECRTLQRVLPFWFVQFHFPPFLLGHKTTEWSRISACPSCMCFFLF